MASQQISVNVNVAIGNREALDAFGRVVARVAHAKEIGDTVKPSEIIGDLMVAADGLTAVSSDPREMRLLAHKRQSGFWYDWSAGESNDPNWNNIAYGCDIFDAKTGEKIRRVQFYHAGTHYVERVAEKNGSAFSVRESLDGSVAAIHEFRELEIREKTG